MPFRSENRQEARDRLLAQSEAENQGMEDATRGTLNVRRGTPTDPNSIEGAHLAHREELRVMRATNDIHEDEVGENGATVEQLRAGRPIEDSVQDADRVNEGVSEAFQNDQARNVDLNSGERSGGEPQRRGPKAGAKRGAK